MVMEEVDINAPSSKLLKEDPNAARRTIPEPVTAPTPAESFPKEASQNQAKETYTPEHKSHIAPLRTFSSDLAQAVRDRGGSVVRIAIAEEEKHRREYEDSSIHSKKNIAFVVGGIILVLGAIGVVIFEYQYKKNASVVAPVTEQQPSSLIHAEFSQTIDVSGKQVADIYGQVASVAAAPGIQPGMMKNIIISQTTAGATTRIPASQFLTTLATHAPADFLRALSPEYMLGVYQYDKGNLFLILRGTAHDFLLAGMLAWEPNLFNDMVPLFGIDTSSMSADDLAHIKFTNMVIGNRETRTVLDANKQPMLFYYFLDQDTLVIATDAKTFSEVVRRF